jgi:DNA modification methylase
MTARKETPVGAAEGALLKHVRQLDVSELPIGSVTPYSNNARVHSKKQVRTIARSLAANGWTNPLLIDDDRVIVAGHGRHAAALELGLTTVPCIMLTGLLPAEIRAYRLADNRIALDSSWDEELLALEFEALRIDGIDLELTGFDAAEIDLMIDAERGEHPDPADELIPQDEGPAVTRLGDLWLLGEHQILCGDATKAESYELLMAGDRARMVFTDPPYNVPIDGHVCGLGSVKHREFAMASGEMSREEFTTFLRTVMQHLAAHSVDGSIHYHCMDWRHIGEILEAGAAAYDEFKNLCVWAKDNGGMGTFYRSRHELVFVFKAGTSPHTNNFGLGEKGRYRTNVWEYRGVNTRRKGRLDELALHPTVKPVAMVADALRDVSGRGEIVLDPFSGSGTTLIAAQKTGRRARVMELDPIYVDRAVRRWQQFAKDEAVVASTGLSFDDTARLRAAERQAQEAA